MEEQIFKGVQLYSVREQLKKNPKGCIQKLSELGFTQAEGFDLVQLSDIKPLLDTFGIEVKSSFLLWSHITGRYDLAEKIQYPFMPKSFQIEYAIDNAIKLGLDTIVCGYLLPEERDSLDDYKRLTDSLNTVGEQCYNAGLRLLYHNHTFEFKPQSGIIPYFYLIDNTDPKYLNFEVDVLWSELAGQDSETLFSILGNRLKQIHLKTGASISKPIYDESLLHPEQHDYPLGTGIIDIKNIINLATKLGVERMYIEQEFSKDIYNSFSKSLAFYKKSLSK